MPKEKRPIQMKFRVSEEERDLIRQRMESLGILHIAAYLRKMALNGYILNLDMPELKEAVSQMKYNGNNINQIAKVANATGCIALESVQELQSQQGKLWNVLNGIYQRLEKLG